MTRPSRLGSPHFTTAVQCPPASGRAPHPTPTNGPLLTSPSPSPLPPVWHCHPPALRGRWPGFGGHQRSTRSFLLSHATAAPAPCTARPRRRGPPTRLCYLTPHASRPLSAGDPLRGPDSPTPAGGRRPTPAGARPDGPSPGLRGAHARGGGGHVAAGGLRGTGLPAAAAALHCLCSGVSGGHALRRRSPRGSWRDLHSAPAAPGPRAGSVGAQAPASRLHAHRCADHHLLLLAHRHHRHLQGRAGAHGLGPRRHGVR